MKLNLKIMRANEVLPINFTIRAFILLIQALLELIVKVLIIRLEAGEDDQAAQGNHEEEALVEEFTVLEHPFVVALEVVAFHNKDLAKLLVEVDNTLDLEVASCKEEVDSNHRIVDRSSPQEVAGNNSQGDKHQLEEDAYILGQ